MALFFKAGRQILFICFALTIPCSGSEASPQPNFVFFITDDVGWNDLACYGNKVILTPHLDALATRGMRFTEAYLTTSSCSPSRCSIITSRYPHNTGAPELHTRLPEGMILFPEELRKAGYFTVLSGKHHMGPNADPAFEKISKGRGPGRSEDWVEILKQRPKDVPFFAWFASVDAHRDWQIDEDNTIYNPEDIEVPPFLYDGPKTKRDMADYYHEVSRIDSTMGKLIAELKRQKIEKDTYIIFMSDNGRPFPRCKTRLYQSGIKTPFIVSCPGTVNPAVTDSLISSIDVGPTVLELAGLKKRAEMQGVSFLKVLKNPKAKVRDFVFAEQNWHVFQAHQRMVRSGDFLYIKNRFPDKLALSKESDATFPAGEELWAKEKAGELNELQRDVFLQPRPEEELYQISDDPFQLHSQAGEKEYATKLKEMRTAMRRWTEQTGDTVPENPTLDRQDADGIKIPGHKHLEMPGAAKNAMRINKQGPVLK